MIVDVWMQHPTLRFLGHDMFASLRRWIGEQMPEEEPPIEATVAAMDSAGVDFGLLSAWSAPHQPPLILVAIGSLGQLELAVERVDGPLTGLTVARARERQLAEHGQDPSAADALVREPQRRLADHDRSADVPVPTRVHVRLQHQPHHLPAATL